MDKYLFTPQKAIAKLKQLLPNESQITMGGRRNGKELELAIRMGIKALEKVLTDKWIPVSERLPEHNKHVLLFLRNSEGKEIQVVGYLYFSEKEELKAYNNEFSVFDGGDMPEFLIQQYVKAWRELPEEYKEE